MKVFKFGGASVKDGPGVRNVARVLHEFPGDDLVVVVSAMGKTTNALEEVVWDYTQGRDAGNRVEALRRWHLTVLAEVAAADAAAAADLARRFDELVALLGTRPSGAVDRDYDQIVSFGEIWSTLIVSAHLTAAGLANTWVDARARSCAPTTATAARGWTGRPRTGRRRRSCQAAPTARGAS